MALTSRSATSSRHFPGRLATSNAEQVRLVRHVLEGLSLEVATPDDAREMLQLKGGDKVAF
jgi:uncharacterized protein (DUF849 family)